MKKKKADLFPYLLITPSAIVILLLLIIPIGYCIYVSLWKCNYMNFSEFVGFSNYIKFFSSKKYMASFYRTFYISFLCTFLSLGLGVVFALWINKYDGIKAYSIQLLVLIPWVTSQVVGTMLWKWIFNEDLGLLNYLFTSLGLKKVRLLSDPTSAFWLLVFVITWRTIGYAMVNLLAGLKSIPDSIEEAATVDGANSFQRLRYIRLPLIKTQVLISGIMLTLSNLNNLTVPLTLTGGGPASATSVLTIDIYKLGFESYQFGLSSAISLLLCFVTVLLSIAYVKAVKYEI